MPPVRYGFASRQEALETLLAEYESIRHGGDGRVFLVGGESGSGRSRLLRELAAKIVKSSKDVHVLVLDRSINKTSVDSWPTRVSPILKGVSTGLKAGGKGAHLMGLHGAAIEAVLRTAGEVTKGLAQLIDYTEARNLPDIRAIADVIQALRMSAEPGKPGVCLIDDIDDSDIDLWYSSFEEFAYGLTGRPLLLVGTFLSQDPIDVDPLAEWPRRLRDRSLARVLELNRLGQDEIAAYIGSAHTSVTRLLAEIGRGNLRATVYAWEAWKKTGAAKSVGAGAPWSLSRDHAAVMDSVGDDIRQRLRDSFEHAGHLEADVRTWLGIAAAFEGRAFTADAVAMTMETDRDYVIDRLDDLVLRETLIDEVDVLVPGLWRYQFLVDEHYTYLQARGVPAEQLARTALHYAQSLEEIYGRSAWLVARELSRIYRIAGKKEAADAWAREHSRRLTPAALELTAANALTSNHTRDWLPADYAWGAELLFTAAASLEGRVGYERITSLQARAIDWAARSGNRALEVNAHINYGNSLSNARDPAWQGVALRTYRMAKQLGDKALLARASMLLAQLHVGTKRAVQLGEQAVALARETGDPILGAYLTKLAAITSENPRRLALLTEARGRHSPDNHMRRAETLSWIAFVFRDMDMPEPTLRFAMSALEEARRTGEAGGHMRIHCLNLCSHAARISGDALSSARYASESLKDSVAFGDRSAIAQTLKCLSHAAWMAGESLAAVAFLVMEQTVESRLDALPGRRPGEVVADPVQSFAESMPPSAYLELKLQAIKEIAQDGGVARSENLIQILRGEGGDAP